MSDKRAVSKSGYQSNRMEDKFARDRAERLRKREAKRREEAVDTGEVFGRPESLGFNDPSSPTED